MLLLLFGFIAPAILFAILGLIACIRRSSYTQIPEDKDQERNSQVTASTSSLYVRCDGSCHDRIRCQQGASWRSDVPPSYSEATSLARIGAPNAPVASSVLYPYAHSPRQSAEVTPIIKIRSHLTPPAKIHEFRYSVPACGKGWNREHLPPHQPRILPLAASQNNFTSSKFY